MTNRVFFCVLASTLAIACGSDSESSGLNEDAGIDAASGSGGTASGGTSTGGSSSGGTSTGGTSSGGTSSGGTSSGGTSTGGTSTGGTASGGTATGGTSGDASVPIEGGTDASTDGPTPTACEQLQTCCDDLGASSPFQPSCQGQVDTGMEANCLAVMDLFCGQVPSGDGGPTVDAGTACQDLSTCCGSLPVAQQADCTTAAGLGSAQICAALLDAYQQSGGC